MIKAIFFDWDDVFINGSKDGYFDCYHETLNKLGVEMDVEEERRRILENWSKRPRDELRGLLKEHPEKLNEACDVYEEMLLNTDTFIKHIKPMFNINSLIERLSKRYWLGIATGMNPKLLLDIMIRFGIPNRFSKIISAYDIDEEEKQKPSSYMLEKLMKFFKISNQEAIYIGDAKSDVLMANNAKIIPVVVLTGHLSESEAKNLGVEYVIEDVTKIDEVLSKIN